MSQISGCDPGNSLSTGAFDRPSLVVIEGCGVDVAVKVQSKIPDLREVFRIDSRDNKRQL